MAFSNEMSVTAQLPPPVSGLRPGTLEHETLPLVAAHGFREYDARWLFGTELNLYGAQAVGLGLGTLIHRRGVQPQIVVGHDFRSYSSAVKLALTTGLMAAGCTVHDIGLALSPMAYFAQFALDVPAVAMVTASHNENGWTGIKMGVERPFTFEPSDMAELKEIVLTGSWQLREGGGLLHCLDIRRRYLDDLSPKTSLSRPLKVVVACGNGTAGAFAPDAVAAMGCDVVRLDCDLDFTFPKYNPNSEALEMLAAMSEAVLAHKADLALGFDGDGDRCGVVDNEGNTIFADKMGVLLARHFSSLCNNALFIADVKSTGIFAMDPILKANGATCEYWKTGHSYMKRRTAERNALAGFEKSGHYFLRPPFGRGYDDGLVAGLEILRLLDRAGNATLAELSRSLPQTWITPTIAFHCPDDRKYQVVADLTRRISAKSQRVAGQFLSEINTVNGIRFSLSDGSWGLVRASSNKPEIVVVCESPASQQTMQEILAQIRLELARYPEVGD